jgi:hypothetical protein
MRDLVKKQISSINKGLCQNYFPLSITPKDSDRSSTASLESIGSLIKLLNDHVYEHEIDMSEIPMHTSGSDNPVRTSFELMRHVTFGCSPFIFNMDEDKLKGIYVKMITTKRAYCKQTINELVQSHYDACVRKDDPITFNKAKTYINERIGDENNPDKVPVIDKQGVSTFYLDLENSMAWVPVKQREGHILKYFTFLLRNLCDHYIKEHPSKTQKIENHMEDITNYFGYGGTPYALNCQRSGEAVGAYHLSELIEFFADNEGESSDISPTTSADMKASENTGAKIKFTNSIDLFVDNTESDGYFRSLTDFSQEKGLEINGLEVVGEILLNKGLVNYLFDKLDLDEETEKPAFLNAISLRYNTKSQNGNIVAKLISTSPNFNLVHGYLSDAINEQFFDEVLSPKGKEKVLCENAGFLVDMLHNSFKLFMRVYIESNKPPENFSESVSKSTEKFS